MPTDLWTEFRKSAGAMYDGFISLAEDIDEMSPHRRAEHEQRRAQFVERRCVEMADIMVEDAVL